MFRYVIVAAIAAVSAVSAVKIDAEADGTYVAGLMWPKGTVHQA